MKSESQIKRIWFQENRKNVFACCSPTAQRKQVRIKKIAYELMACYHVIRNTMCRCCYHLHPADRFARPTTTITHDINDDTLRVYLAEHSYISILHTIECRNFATFVCVRAQNVVPRPIRFLICRSYRFAENIISSVLLRNDAFDAGETRLACDTHVTSWCLIVWHFIFIRFIEILSTPLNLVYSDTNKQHRQVDEKKHCAKFNYAKLAHQLIHRQCVDYIRIDTAEQSDDDSDRDDRRQQPAVTFN